LTRPWNDPYEDIDRNLAQDPDLLLVLEQEDQIVGSVMIGYDGHRGWINYLGVHPGHQGRGLGRVLMEEAERRLLLLGCPKVNLQVRSGNAEALRFYRRIGYAVDDVVSMGRRLEDPPDRDEPGALPSAHRRSPGRGTSGPERSRICSACVPAWRVIEESEPEFAERVRRLFDAGRHKTIATLRADGSPRISGIECEFADGELRFGSMSGARKGTDLMRDPRFALHGPTFHPVEGKEGDWPGEAKIAGRARPAGPVGTDQDGESTDGEAFVADISEVVITGLDAEATKLVVEWWTPDGGLRRVERE
jgi:hypothetical protein